MTKNTLTEEELVCLRGCRSYEQYFNTRQDFENNICGFCQLDRTLNEVVWEDELVLAWETPKAFQRDQLAKQFIIIPKRHVRTPWDLTASEVLSHHDATKFLAKGHSLPGGMYFVRFGSMELNAGTIPHLHWNLWVPSGTEKVIIPMYKNPDELAKNQVRAAGFAKRYEDGEQL